MKKSVEELEVEVKDLEKQFLEQSIKTREDARTRLNEEVLNREPEVEKSSDAKEPAPSGDSQAAEDGDSNADIEAELRKAEERVKNSQVRMHKATQEAAELRRQNADLYKQLEALDEQLKRHDKPDLSKLEEDYPDIAKPLLSKISELEKQLSETHKITVNEREQIKLNTHFDKIRSAHPDYEEVTSMPEFVDWLDRQSAVWKRISKEGTSDEVNELLARYKDTQSPRRSDAARSVAEPKLSKTRPPVGNSKRIWTRDEISSMDFREFQKFEGEIDRAWAEGRIR